MARRSSAFGELLSLIFLPVVWLVRAFIPQKRAAPGPIKLFYKSDEWKRLRYDHLAKQPACVLCGGSAKDGARMDVDHIKPLHRYWNLRLDPHNLQTLCAYCNQGKGGKMGRWTPHRLSSEERLSDGLTPVLGMPSAHEPVNPARQARAWLRAAARWLSPGFDRLSAAGWP